MKIPIGEYAFLLTVASKNQKEIEITLMPINKGGMSDKDAAARLSEMVRKGKTNWRMVIKQPTAIRGIIGLYRKEKSSR